MADIEDSQTATLLFDGEELGVYVGMSPKWSVGSVHETTNKDSPILGSGTDARVLKQYNCTTMEPGMVEVRFIGNPNLTLQNIGKTGMLSISWTGGSYSGKGFAIDLQGDMASGELIRWSMTFQFSGYY